MTEVKAEMVGNVWKVKTEPGAQVAEEDELLILESMKMEIPVTAPRAGTVKEVRVKEGEVVKEGQVLVVLELSRRSSFSPTCGWSRRRESCATRSSRESPCWR